MNKKHKVYLRGDGNSEIGLGHIYRLLAIHSFIKEEFNCTFLIHNPSNAVYELIKKQVSSVITLKERDFLNNQLSSEIVNLINATDILILDGYHFNDTYQSALKKLGCFIVYIDDLFLHYKAAHAVINHCGGIQCSDYPERGSIKLYLGPKYALINELFLKKNVSRKFSKKLFICLGGADLNNYTIKIFSKITLTEFEEIDIVVGASYSRLATLQELAKPYKNVRILFNLESSDIKKVMEDCSIAITSASTISYEYCSVGGLLYIIKTADNQEHIFNYLISENLAYNYNSFNQLNNYSDLEELYKKQIQKQEKIFDGCAGERLKKALECVTLSEEIKLRLANINDLSIYYEWANDPIVRSQAYNTSLIPYEEHKNWFEKKIVSTSSVMYIFEKDNTAFGQVRFDIRNDNTAIIDYSIAKDFRGKGLGRKMLELAIDSFKGCNNAHLIAHIKHDNVASKKIFEKCGFIKTGEIQHEKNVFIILNERSDENCCNK